MGENLHIYFTKNDLQRVWGGRHHWHDSARSAVGMKAAVKYVCCGSSKGEFRPYIPYVSRYKNGSKYATVKSG